MSSAAALNAVRQIQALAEGPPTAEMLSCLNQVATSLQYFLEHPDNYVRLCAARALLKVAHSYREELVKYDLTKARNLHSKLKATLSEGGEGADSSVKELFDCLGQVLAVLHPETYPEASGGNGQEPPNSAGSDFDAAAAAASGEGGGAAPVRGEVVLKAPQATEEKASVLPEVVKVQGVVSVTFEGEHIIVSTRSAALASEATFLAELLGAVTARGLQGVQLVSTSVIKRDDVEDAGDSTSKSSPSKEKTASDPHRSASTAVAEQESSQKEEEAAGSSEEEEDDGDGEEYGYLDDAPATVTTGQREGAASSAAAMLSSGGGTPGVVGLGPKLGAPPTAANYSFFAANNWMQTRKMQEFEDDPGIVARLAKAKKKEQAKREAEKASMGRLQSWFSKRGS